MRYLVTAKRSRDWWVLQAVDAPGAISQVEDLDGAEAIAAEAISFVTEKPADEIQVAIVVVPGAFEISVARDGKFWMVSIPAVDGLTQARTRDEVKRVAAEYIAVTLDTPVSEVTIAPGWDVS